MFLPAFSALVFLQTIVAGVAALPPALEFGTFVASAAYEADPVHLLDKFTEDLRQVDGVLASYRGYQVSPVDPSGDKTVFTSLLWTTVEAHFAFQQSPEFDVVNNDLLPAIKSGAPITAVQHVYFDPPIDGVFKQPVTEYIVATLKADYTVDDLKHAAEDYKESLAGQIVPGAFSLGPLYENPNDYGIALGRLVVPGSDSPALEWLEEVADLNRTFLELKRYI